MFDQVWTFIQAQLLNNNFASGGVLLMVLGAAAAYCRKLPHDIWHWVVARIFIEFEIPPKDQSFSWFSDWLAQQKYAQKRARWLTLNTKNKSGNWTFILSPAPGQHWMWWKGRLLIVRRTRKEPTPTPGSYVTAEPTESFVVSLLTFNRTDVTTLLEQVKAEMFVPYDDDEIEVFQAKWDGWNGGNSRRKRPASSVVLDDGVMEALHDDVQKWKKSEKWYIDRGIPYRRGYLLHGPPGSGKSSTVLALASELNMDIYVISLTNKMDDEKLNKLLGELPPDCIVLIEDIDCVWQARKAEDTTVSFSGLLNAIDGVTATEGRVLFLTTNHKDKLDPALIRPGRCDVHFLIDDASTNQAERIFKRFFPESTKEAEFGKLYGDRKHSMAHLQGVLLNAKTDDEALAVAA